MEHITPPCAVLLPRIHQPIIFYQHRINCIELDGCLFVSVSPPVLLDKHGEPMILQAELPIGSIVRVHAIDGALRSVQVIQVKRINSFAETA